MKRTDEGRGGGVPMWSYRISTCDSAWNGSWPVNISYMITPSA